MITIDNIGEITKSLKFKKVYFENNFKPGNDGYSNYVVLFRAGKLYLVKSKCQRWVDEFDQNSLIPDVKEGVSVFEASTLAIAIRSAQQVFVRNNLRLKAFLDNEVKNELG